MKMKFYIINIDHVPMNWSVEKIIEAWENDELPSWVVMGSFASYEEAKEELEYWGRNDLKIVSISE